MNSVLAQLSYIVHDRLGLKSQAHSESPLKWTVTIVMLCSPLQRTLAMSQEIYFRAGSVRSLMNSVFAQLSYIVHDRLGLKSQADRESPLKWTVTIVMLCSPLQRTLAMSQEFYFRAGSVRSLLNSLLAQLSYIVHDRLGLKSQADRESPLKWTVTIVMLCSPLQRTLAMSQEFYFRAGSVRSLLNSLLAQLSYIVHDRLGLKSQADRESPLKWTLTIVMLCSPLQRTLAMSQEIYFLADCAAD